MATLSIGETKWRMLRMAAKRGKGKTLKFADMRAWVRNDESNLRWLIYVGLVRKTGEDAYVLTDRGLAASDLGQGEFTMDELKLLEKHKPLVPVNPKTLLPLTGADAKAAAGPSKTNPKAPPAKPKGDQKPAPKKKSPPRPKPAAKPEPAVAEAPATEPADVPPAVAV